MPHPHLMLLRLMSLHSLLRRLRRRYRAGLAEPRYLDFVPALRDYPTGARSLRR